MTERGKSLDRRAAMRRIGFLAMLPSLLSTGIANAQGNAMFHPPAGPMLFRRRLLRELPGGEAIIVTRIFEIRFHRLAGGYRVEGAQTRAEVSAPASLGALARLEEQRQETGLFPLHLDANGRIIAGPGGRAASDFATVVDEAFAWLARRPISRADRMQAQEFVIGLQTVASRITTAMPPDLFTGDASPVSRTQPLTMPDGNPGMVSVAYEASARPGGGLLASAERVVTTDAGGSTLRSVEQWTLEPLAQTASR